MAFVTDAFAWENIGGCCDDPVLGWYEVVEGCCCCCGYVVVGGTIGEENEDPWETAVIGLSCG